LLSPTLHQSGRKHHKAQTFGPETPPGTLRPCKNFRKVDHTNPIKTFVRLGAHRHRRRAKGRRMP